MGKYTVCSKCEASKNNIKITASGYCSSCRKEYARNWRIANRDKIKVHNASFNKKNPEKRKEACNKWRDKNKSYQKNKRKERYQKNKDSEILYAKNWAASIGKEYLRKINYLYRKNNRSKVATWNDKRNRRLIEATPKWTTKEDLEKIMLIYEKAKWLECITGMKYDVDHIIPLQGDNVCGLHVWENLQLLERSLNRKKHNKF